MKNIKKLQFIILILLVSAISIQGITIKLGSIAPQGSPWDIALNRIGTEWNRISGGRVKLKIYPGGIAGSQSDMLSKMRIGQLQAAAFTSEGLFLISDDVLLLSLPFLIRTDAELDFILDKMKPVFEAPMIDKGFKILTWSKAGWLNFFSKKVITDPDDFENEKLVRMEGDSKLEPIWKAAGFTTVPFSVDNILFGLQSGMADAIYASPLFSAVNQWFGVASNMCDIKLFPAVGALVISEQAWRRIPPGLKPELERAAAVIIEPLYEETINLEKEAIQIMVDNGLIIHAVSSESEKRWENAFARGVEAAVQEVFSIDVYNDIVSYLEEYRGF